MRAVLGWLGWLMLLVLLSQWALWLLGPPPVARVFASVMLGALYSLLYPLHKRIP